MTDCDNRSVATACAELTVLSPKLGSLQDRRRWRARHGLSYGQVDFGKLHARVVGGALKVSFTMTNSGKRSASAVGQVYVAAPKGSWEAPKRLANFAKATLAPGQSRTVDLDVDPRLLATWDSASKTWKTAPGAYQVLLARSATDVLAKGAIKLPARTLDRHGR